MNKSKLAQAGHLKLPRVLAALLVFTVEGQLKTHANDKHEIQLDLDILSDFNEEDAFIRLLRSIKLESEYIATRKNLYPEHWDHAVDRMKFRMLAKHKLEICSRLIDDNLKQA